MVEGNVFSYILWRIIFRIGEFFRHWYIGGTRYIVRVAMRVLLAMERVFAVRINILHIGEPLYGDYTILGRILGPISRGLRIIAGCIVYIPLGVLLCGVYCLWCLIPIGIIVYSISTFSLNAK